MRRIAVDKLVGAQEIGTRLGVEGETVTKWTQRGIGTPEPVQVLALGKIYNWDEWERWAKETGRLDDDGNPIRRTAGRPKRT